MTTSNSVQQKSPWLLGLLLLSQVILMSVSARQRENDQSVLRTWLVTAVTPVLRGGEWVISGATGTVKGYVALRGARQENEQLRDQVQQLTQERDQARETAAEDARIRAQYGVPAETGYHEIAATVVSRDPSIWFRQLIVNRGTNDGVKIDMPVVTATGIVGRVVAVGPNFSTVQVITDRHAGVGAMLRNAGATADDPSQAPPMGEVYGLDNARCEMRSISSSENVPIGAAVVTNGLDRIYPKGLMVGTVESVQD
ncbi:MAG: rod shape-determining protein MreC, partial [Blastocatellia bacterium]